MKYWLFNDGILISWFIIIPKPLAAMDNLLRKAVDILSGVLVSDPSQGGWVLGWLSEYPFTGLLVVGL